HRMHDRLRMDHDLDLFRWQIEQPACLNKFQSFVEHGCRVDGDLVAHPPGRVIEGIIESGVFNRLDRGVAEWTTAGGQDHLLDLVRLAGLQGREDGEMRETEGKYPTAASRGLGV